MEFDGGPVFARPLIVRTQKTSKAAQMKVRQDVTAVYQDAESRWRGLVCTLGPLRATGGERWYGWRATASEAPRGLNSLGR